MKTSSVLFCLLCFLLPLVANAFPDLSRHGYPNCTACHVSPSGGGLLNEYGRELSKEILSTWAFEGEQKFAYGILPDQDKVLLGAFFRGVQFHKETIAVRQGYPIFMQADAEVGIQTQYATVVGSVGREEIGTSSEPKGKTFSRRHYAMAKFNEHTLRFGKFQRMFGFGDPDHRLYVHAITGFIQDREAYHVEYAYAGEVIGFNFTQTLDKLGSSTTNDREGATAGTISAFLFEHNKIGISVLHSAQTLVKPETNRWAVSPWGLWQWTNQIYSNHEFVWNTKNDITADKKTKSWATSHKLHFEVAQGAIPFLDWEWSQTDRSSDATQKHNFGLGFDWFPRPHFNIQVAGQREVLRRNPDDPIYFAWLMGNYYL